MWKMGRWHLDKSPSSSWNAGILNKSFHQTHLLIFGVSKEHLNTVTLVLQQKVEAGKRQAEQIEKSLELTWRQDCCSAPEGLWNQSYWWILDDREQFLSVCQATLSYSCFILSGTPVLLKAYRNHFLFCLPYTCAVLTKSPSPEKTWALFFFFSLCNLS